MKPLKPKLCLFIAFVLLGAYILVGCTGSRFGSPCPSTGKQKVVGYGSYYRYSPLRDRWVFVTFNNCPEGRPGCIVHHGQVNDSIFSLSAIPNVVDTLAAYRPKYILVGEKSH